MSNIKVDYATFDVEDYKREAKLSSYNLPFTPLTFKARIPSSLGGEAVTTQYNTLKTTFDFGDGTYGNTLTSNHVYEYPGVYNVRMVLRDCNNNSILASYSTDVTIHDYITNTFTVTAGPVKTNILNLSAGEFSNAITINSQSPFYQDFQDIYFSVSGCDVPNYYNLNANRFNNLKKFNSFYKKGYIPSLSGFEYEDINKISLSSANIYVRLSGNNYTSGKGPSAFAIVNSLSTHISSINVGSSGDQVVYFKTDGQKAPYSTINVSFFKDRNNIFSNSTTGYKNNNYSNNFTITLSSLVGATSAQTLSSIAITSSGIPGEGDSVATFAVSPVQYKGLGIPFILSPKNTDYYTMKSLSSHLTPTFSLLSGKTPQIIPGVSGVEVSASHYTIQSLSATLSSFDTTFWYRGLLTFNDNTLASISAEPAYLTLSAKCPYENTAISTTNTVTGYTAFTCYPKNYYEAYKQNEDFDFEQTIKDLRFQEILLDKDILFTDFIGTIFGNVSSSYTVLGKKIWEKIQNFTSNTNDIDYCDINSLINLSDLVDDEGIVFDRSLAQQPELVDRLMSVLSMNYNKFRGTQNKFDENYNPKGHTTKTTYGKNLSALLDTSTYEVSAGTDIVAYEKFSEIYTRLNTYQPISALSGASYSKSGNFQTYMLSNFNTTATPATSGGPYWGWPLVLPATYASITDVNKFYKFYSLSAAYDNTIEGGLIDYSNGLTTLDYNTPLSALEGANNVFDVMIRNSLFSSLSLF
tara:strand:- start:22452 stop:24701 length:2250 start_codon:yes stop_codon:yes gene_type:complete